MAYKDPKKQREAQRRWDAANPDKRRAHTRRWRAANPEKAREATRRWSAANPEKVLQLGRRRRKLPAPTRPEAEWCECCGRWFLDDTPRLDHDHHTGQFRGWLCHACNTGIGMLGDGIEGLEKAIAYLRRTS